MVVVAAVCAFFSSYYQYFLDFLFCDVAECVPPFILVAWLVLYDFKSFHAKRQVAMF